MVKSNKPKISCTVCYGNVIKCNKKQCCFHESNLNNVLLCENCYKMCFPFTSLDNNELISELSVNLPPENISFDDLNNSNLMFESNKVSLNDDIDPDINFYEGLRHKKSRYYTYDDFNAKISCKNDTNISILHVNCRSIKNKFGIFESLLHNLDKKFDIIALTETWLTQNDDLNFYNLEGYTIEHINRKQKLGGGIIIYVNNKLSTSRIENMSFSEHNYMDALALEVQLNNKKINVACIYRPPSTNIHEFNNRFSSYVELLSAKNESYICGDFNIDLLKHDSHKGSKHFVDQFFSLRFFATH